MIYINFKNISMSVRVQSEQKKLTAAMKNQSQQHVNQNKVLTFIT